MLLYFAALVLAFTIVVALNCAFFLTLIGIYVSFDERRRHAPVTEFLPENGAEPDLQKRLLN